MRVAALAFTILLVAVPLLVGCVTPADPATPPVAGEDAAHVDLLAKLRADPAPALDGAGVQKWLDAFVEAHKPRLTGTPLEKAAGDDLEAQLKALGYDAQSKLYNAQGLPSVDGPLRAVLGIKKGTTHPDEIIVLGAHYDTAAAGTSVVGPVPVGTPPLTATYDNGSGTAMVMELARLMAKVATERTVVFALFNGEEEGLLASEAYAGDLKTSGAHVVTYMGFDMVGIAWPSKAGCLCIYAGKQSSKDLNPVQETVAFDLLGYPRSNETVQVFDNHDTRNSDEGAFATAGFPTMRWAGLKSAGMYWAYHKTNDTMETMIAQAGGADLLHQGFETTAASAYYTLLAMDHVGPIAGTGKA